MAKHIYRFKTEAEATKFVNSNKFYICSIKYIKSTKTYKVTILDEDTKGSIVLTSEEIKNYKQDFKNGLLDLNLVSEKIFSKTRRMKRRSDTRDKLTRVFNKPKYHKITRKEKFLLDHYANCILVNRDEWFKLNNKLDLVKEALQDILRSL